MSEQESAQERTEQPTDKRKKESREKGQVARSRDLGIFLSLTLAAGVFLLMGSHMAQAVTAVLTKGLSPHNGLIFETLGGLRMFASLASDMLFALLPFGFFMLLISIAGSVALGGLNFSWKAMNFSVEKLNPISGLKKIFSLKSLMELLKSVIKVTTIALGAYVFYQIYQNQIILLWRNTPAEAVEASMMLMLLELFLLCGALLAVVLIDVPYQLWEHVKKMRMSRQEVKDEQKETDGRPEVKAKIRQLQRQRAQNRMMADVPTASVVITNPNHFAVAVSYESGSQMTPKVVAKGCDLVAAEIRKIAEENAVPLCEAPPLARVLYWNVDIGEDIPQNLYLAVAQILAYVFLVNSGASSGLRPPQNIPIPEEYRDDMDRGVVSP